MSEENLESGYLDELPISSIEVVNDRLEQFIDRADVSAVYGKAIRQGDTYLIPTAEIITAMGFGIGEGGAGGEADPEKPSNGGEASGGGGGGGGTSQARPVAVIVAGPQGVHVQPIYDWTKIYLAALTTFGFMIATLAKFSRDPRD